jgi:hypothetical protein
VSIAAQSTAGVQESTPEGDIVSTLGMGVSVFVNLLLLFVAVLLGHHIIDIVPPVIQEALLYIVPALFGALLVAYSARYPKLAAFVVPLGVLAILAGLEEAALLVCLVSSVGFGTWLFKKGLLKSTPF